MSKVSAVSSPDGSHSYQWVCVCVCACVRVRVVPVLTLSMPHPFNLCNHGNTELEILLRKQCCPGRRSSAGLQDVCLYALSPIWTAHPHTHNRCLCFSIRSQWNAFIGQRIPLYQVSGVETISAFVFINKYVSTHTYSTHSVYTYIYTYTRAHTLPFFYLAALVGRLHLADLAALQT